MALGVFATIVLQEMAARLGLVTQAGLGEALNRQFPKGTARLAVFALTIGAILIGNAAYEAGNIAGGVLGVDVLIGPFQGWPLLLGAACAALLYYGGYRWAERLLIGLVLVMSTCFLLTAMLIKPNLSALFAGFVPQALGTDDWLLIAGLVGTTVVPYNLFLHAATIPKKYGPDASLAELRRENAVAILLGGLVSACIIITAAGSGIAELTGAADMAIQLEPTFGPAAKYLMAAGLLAAGVSSALTAPLAAAYAARGLFGWPVDDQDPKFRAVWAVVLAVGVLVATTGINGILVIRFAQITNALLLPFIAGYLLYICNSKNLLGGKTNSGLANVAGGAVILITIGLAIRTLTILFG